MKKQYDHIQSRIFTNKTQKQQALITAAKKGLINYMNRYHYDKNDYNFRDEDGNTALYYSVKNQDENMTITLLNKGANPNIICSEGNTALHLAFMMDNEVMIGALLDKNADLNLINDYGLTPLAYGSDQYVLQSNFQSGILYTKQNGGKVTDISKIDNNKLLFQDDYDPDNLNFQSFSSKESSKNNHLTFDSQVGRKTKKQQVEESKIFQDNYSQLIQSQMFQKVVTQQSEDEDD